MSHPLQLLRELYPDISNADIEEIGLMIEETHVKCGTELSLQHNVLHQGIYIKKGGARVYFIEKGKEHTISFAFDNEYLPAGQVINMPDTNIVISFIEDSDILYIPQYRIVEILANASPENQVKALKFVNATLVQISRTLDNRLFHMLHSSATDRYKWAAENYPRIFQSATTAQIASYLGISRETLTRIRNNNY